MGGLVDDAGRTLSSRLDETSPREQVLTVSQHDHISRAFLVCLCISFPLTTRTDSPVCCAGALTKQLSDLPLSKTCVAHLSDIVIEHTRVPQQAFNDEYFERLRRRTH